MSLNIIEFEWPEDVPPKQNNQQAITDVLKLIGHNPNRTKYYKIRYIGDYLGIRSTRIKQLNPGEVYWLFPIKPDNLRFVWPKSYKPQHFANRDTQQTALKLAGYPLLDPSDYFIASGPNKSSVQWEGIENLQPGHTYYLRPI
jgi:hypothetical protein